MNLPNVQCNSFSTKNGPRFSSGVRRGVQLARLVFLLLLSTDSGGIFVSGASLRFRGAKGIGVRLGGGK